MKKIKGQIYIHTSKITGKHYVGQTIANPVEARWANGRDSYNKTTKFGRAIKKYGWESFEHTILPEIYESHEELDKAEVAKIAELDSYKNGYNSTLGGNGSSGYVKSEESKKKISESLKKSSSWHNHGPLSEEHKDKISNSLKGRRLSASHIEKMREVNKNKKMSEESKKKMSASHIGIEPWNKNKKGIQRHSPETIKKISNSIKALPKRDEYPKCSEATKLKISVANSGKRHSDVTRMKMRESQLKRWQDKRLSVL